MKKPAGTAVDPRNGQPYELRGVTGEKPELDPDTRSKLTPASLAAFDAVIASPVANVFTKADHVVLVRWVKALARYEEAMEDAEADPVTPGSMGQGILSPFFKVADQAMAIIKECEKQLGIGPKNRADLGITLIAAGQGPRRGNAPTTRPSDEVDPRKVVDG